MKRASSMFNYFGKRYFSRTIAKRAIDTKQWMKSLDSKKLISEIIIPGTHDSASFKRREEIGNGNLGFVQTQNDNITSQLLHGIRFLDIRCRRNNTTQSFDLYHGKFYLKQSFQEILVACNTFLIANPSETILLSVSKEEENRVNNPILSFEQTLKKEMSTISTLEWYLEKKIPTMEQVRKKIILLQRDIDDGSTGLGIYVPWKNNETNWTTTNAGLTFRGQDKYIFTSINDKYNAVITAYQNALNEKNKDKLWFNFTSASLDSGAPKLDFIKWARDNTLTPNQIAEKLNPKLNDYFSQNNNPALIGLAGMIFVLDYADLPNNWELVNKMLARNGI